MDFDEYVYDQVEALAECMPHFPKSERFKDETRKAIMAMLGHQEVDRLGYRGMSREQRLDWLISAFIQDVGDWPSRGLIELRAVYCAFFPAADGKGAQASQLPGWTQEDLNGDRRAPSALPRVQDQTQDPELIEMTPEERAEYEAEFAEFVAKMKAKGTR